MNTKPEALQHRLPPPAVPGDLAPYIDHTLLRPEATREQIETLCREAIENHFYAVCVNGAHVETARKHLDPRSSVNLAAVVAFPLGAMATQAKAFEAETAARDGATEIDMVMRIDLAKTGDWAALQSDIHAVVKAVAGSAIVKVILETGFLTPDEIVRACRAADGAGAHFVKTCTGFSTGSATVEHIALMKKSVSPRMQVKASGGVRSFESARDLILAGATRIGTSSGAVLVRGSSPTSGY